MGIHRVKAALHFDRQLHIPQRSVDFGLAQTNQSDPHSFIQLLRRLDSMSDTFRKAMLNRLPPMAPTRAPWAAGNVGGMDEDQEELEEGDSMAELGQRCAEFRQSSHVF